MQLLKLCKCQTKTYGLSNALFKSLCLWNKLLNDFKEAKSSIHFNIKIREWTGRSCTYKQL